jgi:hypothetical protein
VSEDKEKQSKHSKEDPPKWPGTEDTGKTFDEWLEKSNKEAEGK